MREMQKGCRELLLVTNQPTLYKKIVQPKVHIIQDEVPFQGPLGGMRVALSKASYDHVWIVACDMPYLSSHIAHWMVKSQKEMDYDAVVPVIRGKIHPLYGIYHRRCKKIVQDLLQESSRRVIGLLDRIDWLALDEAFFQHKGFDLRFVTNVNTPEDYQQEISKQD
jgi:molybdopterin-guanine dinucleotide biosynthesis protein A